MAEITLTINRTGTAVSSSTTNNIIQATPTSSNSTIQVTATVGGPRGAAGADGDSASVSDTAYGVSWNGVTDVAPSKNAVYDKIETISAASGITEELAIAYATAL